MEIELDEFTQAANSVPESLLAVRARLVGALCAFSETPREGHEFQEPE